MTEPSLKTIFEYNTIKMSDKLHDIANGALRYGDDVNSLIHSIRDVADHSSQQYAEHADKFKENSIQETITLLEEADKFEIDINRGGTINISSNKGNWYNLDTDAPFYISLKGSLYEDKRFTGMSLDEVIQLRNFLNRAIATIEIAKEDSKNDMDEVFY